MNELFIKRMKELLKDDLVITKAMIIEKCNSNNELKQNLIKIIDKVVEEDALNNFKKVVKDDENKDLLFSFFKKHEHLFCDKNEVRRKKLVPIEYNKRIFRGI